MKPLDLVGLTPLMEVSSGDPEVVIGLMDGPVFMDHPDLVTGSIREAPGGRGPGCVQPGSSACVHGTFVAGILCAERESGAPAICPGCTLLVRPIFSETSGNGHMPSATPGELAAALIETIDAGVRILNLSAAFAQPSSRSERELEEALDYAAWRGVIVIVAAGNQGTLGSSAITRHPWVIPVVACDLQGRPTSQSNLGSFAGRRGLRAPGEGITSLGTQGQTLESGGTSVAAPFVTGTIALLWSEFPDATAAEVRSAVTGESRGRRTTVVPPVLDAWTAYEAMARVHI
jgi:subtilisin family serine protease